MSDTPVATAVPTETPSPTPSPSLETTTETTTAPEPKSLIDTTETTEAAPEPFDAEKLTLPEGFEKNDHFSEFATLAKEAGFTQEASQKLVDLYAKAAKVNAEASAQAWQEQNTKWQDEVKADKELGGGNLEGVLNTIAKVLDNPEFTDPKLREALNFTGAGNHPAVVRSFYRIGKVLGEGKPVAGNPAGTTATRPSIAESLYPGGPRSSNPRME